MAGNASTEVRESIEAKGRDHKDDDGDVAIADAGDEDAEGEDVDMDAEGSPDDGTDRREADSQNRPEARDLKELLALIEATCKYLWDYQEE